MNAVVKFESKDEPVTYTVRQVLIGRIRAFAGQPRKYFDAEEIRARAQSMKSMGQQDPVTVEPVYGDPDHDFELINGESRLRSALEAGLSTLWAAVRSVPFGSKVEKHLASLVANFNRADHTPMEVSDALRLQVTEGGRNQDQIARALGKSLTWVSLYLSLQRLHPDLQAAMHPTVPRSRRLAASTGFELARLSMEKQEEILRLSRDPSGTVIMKRVRARALKASGQEIIQGDNFKLWTKEREHRYQAHHYAYPEHVAHLRAGIAEFRLLLEEGRSHARH